MPQSHISRIESNQVDLRISSLIAIANALDLEVTLVPRKDMPAAQSIVRHNDIPGSKEPSRSDAKPAYNLDGDD